MRLNWIKLDSQLWWLRETVEYKKKTFFSADTIKLQFLAASGLKISFILFITESEQTQAELYRVHVIHRKCTNSDVVLF